ncbi:ENHANCER OF AG-4 protein 2-like [Citrus sinensis]|uniref:Transmembrane protein n=2 Tax=Citrus TaxID=2706 RepID=A0A067GD68_CITSI|nr:ENHANCER OF AG-4 protein 2-like [Citrus sinensis]KDO77539.1 hypothetical protein CISIN_1g032120mg [Citrus sinensis]
MASQASRSSAFDIIFILSLIIYTTTFVARVDSRPLQKPLNDGDHHSEGNKVTNSLSFNENNNDNDHHKAKGMKQPVNEMKDLPPFPNIPDMPFAPFPPCLFPFPPPFDIPNFPPPFDIPNIPPLPDFPLPPLPPFPNLPPFPFSPPA